MQLTKQNEFNVRESELLTKCKIHEEMIEDSKTKLTKCEKVSINGQIMWSKKDNLTLRKMSF